MPSEVDVEGHRVARLIQISSHGIRDRGVNDRLLSLHRFAHARKVGHVREQSLAVEVEVLARVLDALEVEGTNPVRAAHHFGETPAEPAQRPANQNPHGSLLIAARATQESGG